MSDDKRGPHICTLACFTHQACFTWPRLWKTQTRVSQVSYTKFISSITVHLWSNCMTNIWISAIKKKKSQLQMKQSLASDNTVSSLSTFWLGVWIYFSTFYTNGNIGERGPLSSAVSPIWYILCSGSVQRQQAAAWSDWLTLPVKLIGGALRLPDLTHTW